MRGGGGEGAGGGGRGGGKGGRRGGGVAERMRRCGGGRRPGYTLSQYPPLLLEFGVTG